ncbi:SAM-dependent methyltransferase [Plantactinospora sp. ZYX-F-223]|uniref:SAM-dependent methyltransferase n=1 Tax=Plantactinospora sp. ZYX-F-223 TaxID=3144103 RepID=UPI0031FD278A
MTPDQFLTVSASYDPALGAHEVARQQFDTSRPHPARRYDYWLGGKDNFAADRESGDRIAEIYPRIRAVAQANRAFLRRAVSFLVAEAGIHQFLDLGAGLPTSPNVHEVAQAIAPASRTVYVDNDPMVVTHGHGLTTSTPQGAITHLQGDLRNPEALLADPALHTVLDMSRPIGVLLIAVLHFLDDHDDPRTAVAQLVRALPAGSYLAVSHATFDPLPTGTAERLAALTATGAHGTFQPRTRSQLATFLDGLELVDPGLVPITQWRSPQRRQPDAAVDEIPVYGAVGCRP